MQQKTQAKHVQYNYAFYKMIANVLYIILLHTASIKIHSLIKKPTQFLVKNH